MLIKDKIANKFQLDGTKILYGIAENTAFALDTITGYFKKLPKELNPLRSLGNNFLFHDKRIVIIDSLPRFQGEVEKLYVDFLWIRNNPVLKINDMKKLYNPGIIIIDGSNTYYKTGKWMTEFKKAGLKAFSLKNSGAYIVDL